MRCKKCNGYIAPGKQRQHYSLKHSSTAVTVHDSQQENGDDAATLDFPLGYATGRIEALLEAYAGRLGLAPASFTARVARLLQRSARGQTLGPAHPVPKV